MKAALLMRERVGVGERAFAELVLWQLPRPSPGSAHRYRYRLAYVVDDVCVLRHDNEAGKGDHRHVDEAETLYRFESVDRLIADFLADIERWNREHRDP